MSYLIEFQRQQKALRDAERDRKKNASSMLNNYRGSEHDIKEQQKLKALKDAERDNKKNASAMLNNYRGGEHDIKEQKQLKAQKDAERENKKKASSMLSQYRGSKHDIKEQQKLKALKDAERGSKKNASAMLHKYRGGEHDIKDQQQQKSIKDAERNSKRNASKFLHSYKGGEHDVKDYERAIIREKSEHRRSSYVSSPEPSDHASESTEDPVVSAVSTAVDDLKIETEKDGPREQLISKGPAETASENNGHRSEKSQAREKYEQSLSNSPTTDTKSSRKQSGTSRKALSIDFMFGIILPDYEPDPEVEFCQAAAAAIVPHVISQWTNETNIFCNPKTPEVIGEIDTDDWYDGEDSIRYKVKGKVPVQVFAESSLKEVEEGLKKVLRRRVSYRPLSEEEEAASQNVIGDGDQKWMRVRDGVIGGLGITF